MKTKLPRPEGLQVRRRTTIISVDWNNGFPLKTGDWLISDSKRENGIGCEGVIFKILDPRKHVYFLHVLWKDGEEAAYTFDDFDLANDGHLRGASRR